MRLLKPALVVSIMINHVDDDTLIELIYISQANPKPTKESIEAILYSARRRNAELGITGLLIFDGESRFWQVLEGKKVDVEAVYQRITEDERHTDIQLFSVRQIQKREFPQWLMGYQDIGTPDFVVSNEQGEFVASPDKTQELKTKQNTLLLENAGPGTLIELMYVSHAKPKPTKDTINAIVKSSRKRNARLEITGLLVFNGVDRFWQVLEGDKAHVEMVYQRIVEDDRHADVQLLSVRELEERSFPQWNMGYQNTRADRFMLSTEQGDFVPHADRHAELEPNQNAIIDLFLKAS